MCQDVHTPVHLIFLLHLTKLFFLNQIFLWKILILHNQPSRSGWVVYSAVLTVCGMDGCWFEPQPEPLPMLVDTSVSMWIKKVWLPCWPLSSQQVSHQRWTWESHKQKSKHRIHPGFETQGRCLQKSKTGVSVLPPTKGLMSSKNLKQNNYMTTNYTRHLIVYFLKLHMNTLQE